MESAKSAPSTQGAPGYALNQPYYLEYSLFTFQALDNAEQEHGKDSE